MAKEHKKLYKAGKNWLVATLFAVAAGTALATASVHADTTTDRARTRWPCSRMRQRQLGMTRRREVPRPLITSLYQ